MSEFVFNRATLVAMAVVTTLLLVLTFSAGLLSGALWVRQLTPAERLAMLGSETSRDSRAEPTAIRPAAAGAPRRSDPAPAPRAAVLGAAATDAGAPAVVEPPPAAVQAVAAFADLDDVPERPRRAQWVKISALDWRRVDEQWSAGLDSIDMRFDDSHPVPPTPYGELIYQAARRHSMNPILVAAMVRVESNFDPDAVSPAGARGLMQVMPDTARRFGVEATALHDPARNLEAGVSYLKWLSRRFTGDLSLTLGAYNAGEEAVERYRGLPPYSETLNYVERVYAVLGLARYEVARHSSR